MKARLAPVLLAILLSAATSLAGTYSLDWSTDKEPVSYQPGETMTFHISISVDSTVTSRQEAIQSDFAFQNSDFRLPRI